MYHSHDVGQEIAYCRRPNGSQLLSRHKNECDHQGTKLSFDSLLKQEVHPRFVLEYSSSIEMADLYAAVFYNRSLSVNDNDQFVCNCTTSGTFGKYCEYQLTYNAKSFTDAIKSQFEQKKLDKEQDDSWNSQRHGKIVCYETLSYPSSPLCLDWREICDGKQRCSNGIDEENCDKLEFNECEDDEFRRNNGMCISEEFWADGDYDCMDWSDEYHSHYGQICSVEPNAIECDEHLCLIEMYSCGDGECVPWETRMAFQRFSKVQNDCFNKRNLNYMCEVSQRRTAWTLESGLCLPDKDYDDLRYPPWNMINTSKLSDEEKCEYLFRCVLSKGFEHDCPCNHLNCLQIMRSLCPYSHNIIFYPPDGLIDPNIFFIYNYSQSMENPAPHAFLLSGGLRCRGYFYEAIFPLELLINFHLIRYPSLNKILCAINTPFYGYKDFLSPYQNDKFCWNNSLTFNGRPYAVNPDICSYAGECISQYRIRDGYPDCYDQQDEKLDPGKNYCTENVGRHRFQCFNDQHKCLQLPVLGSGYADCSNNYDISWFGTGTDLRLQLFCFNAVKTDCHRLKEYIQQSFTKNPSGNSSFIDSQPEETMDRMPFRHYCDSFWNSDTHFDETPSSCQYWTCQNHQYQCRTGQCIPLAWVCDGEWDCSDASDEEAVVLSEKPSVHNARLGSLFTQLEKCQQRYSKSPFSNICNTSFEFGCYLSRVSNPLDIQSNRPCINLTQIGDGIEDCYNAYDEKNTFTANLDKRNMWGYYFNCGNEHIIYPDACHQQSGCDQILCSHYRDNDGSCSGMNDFICLGENHCRKNARCDQKFDCLNGEVEYWCVFGTMNNQMKYRSDKWQISLKSDDSGLPLQYPFEDMLRVKQQQLSKSSVNLQDDQPFRVHSYKCNQGITVLQMNETRCFCPPAYYGDWCEFFSDRISIIALIDQESELKRILNVTLKIRVNFYFDNRIIDHHEFHVVPILEKDKIIKHKFYLLFARTTEMLAHKQSRYFNRSDVINNHPYSIHFDIFSLEENNNIKQMGSWFYPIYFDYLPAFRLAVVLKFPFWLGNATLDPCTKSTCNKKSTCIPVFNKNNSYYCSCISGYYGTNCNMYEPLCETYCSANAFCRPDGSNLENGKNKLYCICPQNHFGPRCNLKYDYCHSNPCLNNGTCFSNYDPTGKNLYWCNCTERFGGSECQEENLSVYIELNMTKTWSVRAAVVQFYDYQLYNFMLLIRQQQMYKKIPFSIRQYQSNMYPPVLATLKIYEDSLNPQYFLIYFLYQTKINITSSPYHCPHASSLLSEEIDHFVTAIFKYHYICQNDTERLCFYDENYFCICEKDRYRAECFILDIQHDRCSKCLFGGKCLQGDLQNPNDFICFCPFCHQGDRCEFSMQAFSFTLDSLLVGCSKKSKIIYSSIVCLLCIVGFCNNLCSFVTFQRSTPRNFSVGNYLLIVSCFNQTALFFLLFKFIQITFGIIDIISCKAISCFLAVMTRSTYWLTSWVSVDRLLMVIFPTLSSVKNSRLAIVISFFTTTFLFGMHTHEIMYYTVIQHHSTGLPICVTNFDTNLIFTYNRISTLIHHLFPFFVQVICVILLVILVARIRLKTIVGWVTFGEVLKKQFFTQKELYITPTIIILSALPQVILTFSFACNTIN
ncbi:hypothetical protein I4U23_017049 [Adineta vaga]|nr:hypothetical protein I4U23_017049 [Adineta vaga]